MMTAPGNWLTPSPSLPTRGRVPGSIVPSAQKHTSPLVGEVGRGVFATPTLTAPTPGNS